MKIGLVGYGYWGAGYVARNIARVADLAVIVDPDPVKMAAASAQWQAWGTRVASEPEVAFRDCDAVWIATPASTHSQLVVQALGEGCHVLCEKPFVLRSDEADELVDEAESQGLALMIGHVSLYTKHHDEAKEFIGCRDDSAVFSISVKRNTERASISDHSVLWGLGPHDIASVIDLVGVPATVACRGNSHRVELVLSNDKSTTTVELDWLSNKKERRFSIECLLGGEGVFGQEISEEVVEPVMREAQSFVDLCEGGREQDRRLHYDLARSVVSVLSAAEISMKAGMSV